MPLAPTGNRIRDNGKRKTVSGWKEFQRKREALRREQAPPGEAAPNDAPRNSTAGHAAARGAETPDAAEMRRRLRKSLTRKHAKPSSTPQRRVANIDEAQRVGRGRSERASQADKNRRECPDVTPRRLGPSLAYSDPTIDEEFVRSLSERTVVLEEAIFGREIEVPGVGKAFLIEERLGCPAAFDGPPPSLSMHLPAELHDLPREFSAALAQTDSALHRLLRAAYGDAETLSSEDVIFLDLETTGLNNSPVFLIGTMVWEDDALVVRQFLARNYAEERAILSLFHDGIPRAGRSRIFTEDSRVGETGETKCASHHGTRRRGTPSDHGTTLLRDIPATAKKLLISFNGKAFDFPYLQTRAAATGTRFAFAPAHLDLLHAVRRVWRGRLPDCKLQTLERFVCGRRRQGDIPGHLIPEAYHAYVRTGNAVAIIEILKHNLLDLLTMADLVLRLPHAGGETSPK